MSDGPKKPIVGVCGLWENEKNGRRWLSGSIGGVKVLVFVNDKRGNQKAPDWRLCVTERERDDQAPAPKPEYGSVAAKYGAVDGSAKPLVDDDDIPF